MKVKTEITIDEVNGKETHGLNQPKLKVKSHWNLHRYMVVLKLGKKEVTVNGNKLKEAISKAMFD